MTHDRLETNARTVSLLTLLSRVTGLVRDAALSRVFGAGPLMSAFFFAFLIPNLFRRLFGEGALAAAFLPAYTKLLRDDEETARALASMTVAALVTFLGLLTVVIELLLVAWSSTRDELSPSIVLLMIMLPYMPMVCLVAILGAMLQTHGRFGPAAAAPVVLNLCVVGAALGFAGLFDVEDPGEGLTHACIVAASVIVAGAVQIAWALLALRTRPWWTTERDRARDAFRRMLRVAGPMVLSLGVLQFNTFLDGIIASYPVTFESDTVFGATYPLDESAMAVLGFAQRLYQFPLGVFGIAVATAIFPLLAVASDDGANFRSILQRGLRLVLFIGLPASVGLMLVADPLTRVIYEGGRFDPAHTERVAHVLLGYAPAIWAYSMTHVATRAFYARDDSRRPMRIAISIVGLNLVMNLVLIWFLRETGLAVSTAICSIVQLFALLLSFRAHERGLLDRQVIASWLRTAAATAAMAAGVWGLSLIFDHSEDNSWAHAVIELIALTGAGMGIVAIAAAIMRMPELKWTIGRK